VVVTEEPRLIKEPSAEYVEAGWWSAEPLSEIVRRQATRSPDTLAYVDGARRWTWAEYDAAATRLARVLVGAGLAPGDRVAVHLPDSGLLHAAYVAGERAGVVTVGIPSRATAREVGQLVERTTARALVCTEAPPEAADGGAELAVVVAPTGEDLRVQALSANGADARPVVEDDLAGRALGPNDLWLLNFTSGTTGLPKAVTQTQNRWIYLARAATTAAEIGPEDIVLSAVPGPYGFGLWTGHVIPALHGAACCLVERFSPEETLRMIERERVTVLACVTTQLVMMLGSPAFAEVDLSSLRVVYTGGEKVSATKAGEWEDATGSRVLQFYGSNEAGPFSCTAITDDRETRLETAGRIIDGVDYVLLNRREEQTPQGPVEVGQVAVRSPGASASYWGDPAANEKLYTDDGYLIMPDIVSIDAEWRVRVVGRESDIIIRGGKNISATVVEQEVSTHPAVRMAVAVPVPDETFGERIGVAVALRADVADLDLGALKDFLLEQGVSKEYLPEHLRVVDEIPMSMGAKADKTRIKRLFAES
jgi:acyl-CoA synthetase